jgi:hypothetical protein
MHGYRTWSEAHPRGYVQRGQGLKSSSIALARWRANKARQEPARFDGEIMDVIAATVPAIAAERGLRLHAQTITATHVHVMVSFHEPLCECEGAEFCRRGCPAKEFVEKFTERLKQKMGQAIAKSMQTSGRRWFSRGYDLTPVRNQEHFDYLCTTYLPKHRDKESGIFYVYP